MRIHMKRYVSLLLAIVMVLSMAIALPVSAAENAGETLDYGDTGNWAYYALGEDKDVDVFLICPTVDTRSETNSFDLNDKLKGKFVSALDMEKGIYEETGRLFSPYYRQMSMNAYKLPEAEREKALEVAYADVAAAFRWYLDNENDGRGLILAGFSQGSQMCLELLKKFYGGDSAEARALRENLIAVYAIGWSVTEETAEAWPQITPARGETDTGVVVSFDCEDGSLTDTLVIPAGTVALSINPLNWKTDGTAADASLCSGAVMSTGAEPIPGLCGAYIGARGELVVTGVSPADYPAVIDIFPEGAYHIYDYMFFFTNLKDNVAARAAAWDTSLTRAGFLERLWRTAGEPVVNGILPFDDVQESAGYAEAVRWAVSSGIVNGYGDGRFGPDDPVTKEQMAAVLYRSAQALGQGFRGMWYFLLDYPDADQISDWADEAIHWCVMNGIIVGTDRGLEPKTTVTKGQLTQILQRWQDAVAPAPEEAPALTDARILHEEEFGGVYICCTIEDFNALGFTCGDSVTITFSNGYVLDDLPYYNGYYTATGQPLLIAYPGYPYIKAAINNGDDLFAAAGLQEGDTASVTLREKGKYAAIQDARDIHYTDKREDYASDAVFANFRSVQAGSLRHDTLYRSASPCDNQHARAACVDALISEAGVAFILNLADNEQKIQGYLENPGFSSLYFLSLYQDGMVEPIALNMNFGSQEFKTKAANGLAVMAEKEGPYLVHCTEGKDRTGFVCMLLEALCGASYEEIVSDYMITYDNYYGITEEKEKERYDVIVENVLVPMIRSLAGNEDADVRTADLPGCAERYLLDGGMSAAQIELLRERLTGG